GWSRQDILNQLDYTRRNNVAGQAYFRTENMLSNTKNILTALESYYKYPAKLPSMTWLSDAIPDKPFDLPAEILPSGVYQWKWELNDKESRVTYHAYRNTTGVFIRDKANDLLAVGLREPQPEFLIPDDDNAFYYYITVSDSYHNES